MFDFFRSTLNPAAFHGQHAPSPFFEGWYFKLVSADERCCYSIIPGVFKGQDEKSSHSFVQVLNGISGESNYHAYPYNQFWAARGEFDVRIGPNRFTSDRIFLDIERPEQRIQGELNFLNLAPWPVTLTSPGIMGWYAWIPRMECYHGVVSLDHAIQGGLTIADSRTDFTHGRGYIEKDWGKSFPAAWIWFQSNHFDHPGISVTASVAIIPWLGHAFPGFIIGVLHHGKLYRFATYTGARIERLEMSDREIFWVVADRTQRLSMRAKRSQGGLIKAPTPTGMDRRIAETLTADVFIQLSLRKNGADEIIFSGTGRNAGLEAAGDLARMTGMLRKTQPGSITITSLD